MVYWFLAHGTNCPLLHIIIYIITSSDYSHSRFRSMTMRIIMWTLKLLDTEHSIAKALQAGAKLDL